MTTTSLGSPAAPEVSAATADLVAIKANQQATWARGDDAAIGTSVQIVGETLAEAAVLPAGERVLDVAAGNASLAAARRYAEVTSSNYVPTLLVVKGRRRAEAEGLPTPAITWRQGLLGTFGRFSWRLR